MLNVNQRLLVDADTSKKVLERQANDCCWMLTKAKKWLFVVGCEKWLFDMTQYNNQAWPY